MQPVKLLFASRKFLLLLLDAVLALVMFIVAQFLPDWQKFLSELFVIIQPIFVAVIIGIAAEDAAEKFGSK